MIAAFALMLAAAQLVSGGRGLTIDWPTLAMLPGAERPALAPAVHDYVAREARAWKCPVGRTIDGRAMIQADIAVLVGDDGSIRATIPRAIQCPTVEQFAAGYVQSGARDPLRVQKPTLEGGWYRATLVFAWTE